MLRSWTNELFFQCRAFLKFRRRDYCEKGTPFHWSKPEAELVMRFKMQPWASRLSTLQFRRNLATLWMLDSFGSWGQFVKIDPVEYLEVGCQDFSRLLALRAFFKHHGIQPKMTGIEVDAYPVLADFHSRWDRAQYYCKLLGFQDDYIVADFFNFQKTAQGIFCFFPFVSEHPALCWGLPARFADAKKWLHSFLKCLEPGGFLFVVHQGEGEQEVFDHARAPFLKELMLVERHPLSCPFLPPKITSFASLYQRVGSANSFDN